MIERLRVHNFRCFENFALELTQCDSALLIGKNGSGKSTLRHAFTVLQSIGRGAGRVRALISESDFTQQRTQIPMRFEIELKLANQRFKYSISFEMPEGFREARIADESLSVDGGVIFSREQAQVTLGSGAAFRLDWHVPALPVINERPGDRSVERIRSFFASMILVSPIPAAMSGFSEEESDDLQGDASNFASWVNSLLSRRPAAYGSLTSFLAHLIPDMDSIENVPRGEKGKQLLVKFAQENSNRSLSIEFKHLSDGEKCYFLGAAIFAFSKSGDPTFCLWDEPDNHLSLSEVGHFITEMRRTANQDAQFLATSHHPETIRKFSDENTFVFTRESHFEPTVVRSLADLTYEGDLIDALIRDDLLG